MNLEDIKKKQKKVMVCVMLLCIVLAVGASYAYFTAGITSEDETTVTAEGGIMKINYNGGNTISLSGIYPRDEVWATKIITVTGNNTTDAEMYYKLTLVVDSNTFDTSDPLQYELVSINRGNNGTVIPAISKTNLTSSSLELGKGNFLKADNAVHIYQLKIYYPLKDTDQNSNQGAVLNAHVEITDEKGVKGKLITFVLDGTEYEAEEGMTLAEWVNSEYNVYGYHLTANYSQASKIIIENSSYNLYDLEKENFKAGGFIISNVSAANFEDKYAAQFLYHVATNDGDYLKNVCTNIYNNNYLTQKQKDNYCEISKTISNSYSFIDYPLHFEEDLNSDVTIEKSDEGYYIISSLTIKNLQRKCIDIRALIYNVSKGGLFELVEVNAEDIDLENHALSMELEDISGVVILYNIE